MEDTIKIYFIYTQHGEKNKIKEFTADEKIIKVEELSKEQCNEKIQVLYCAYVSKNIDEDEIEISLDDEEGENYYSNIYLDKNEENDFIFNLIFEHRENDAFNHLEQAILPVIDQFYFFEKNFKNKDDILINLYSKAINQILFKPNKKFNFILYIFFQIFDENKYNNLPKYKDALIYFFENIEKILLNCEYDQKLQIPSEKLDILSDTDNIRTKLIEVTGVVEENIDLFLAYYYIYYKKKVFIEFISNKNYSESVKKTLEKNREYFNNFTTEIINSELIDEAESLEEILYLMELYPDMVEFFKILTNELVYLKLVNLKQIYHKTINPMLIHKPKSTDDIESLQKYFNKIDEIFRVEEIYPVVLKEDFFVEYYKCFEEKDEDFVKNMMIIEMLNLFNNNKCLKIKINTETIFKMHLNKGISLLKNKKLKNYDFIRFYKGFPDLFLQNIDIIKDFPDGIEFNEQDKKFTDEVLNFDTFNFKKLLGNNYEPVLEKIFEKFVYPKDLSAIRFFEISSIAPLIIVKLLMNTIKRVWVNNPENNCFGLDNLFVNVFSYASLKLKDFSDIISQLEEKIAPEKLMGIYSHILIKELKITNDFKKHMVDFIQSYKKFSPLYLWCLYCSYSDGYKRINLLSKHLNKELAVKYNDFIDHPKKFNEKILLFVNLKNYAIIPFHFTDSEYYKLSMNSKNELEKNIFKDAVNMNKNLQKIYDLLYNFFCDNEDDSVQLTIIISDFKDKVEKAEKYYDSLNTIKNFWEKFFKEEKKESLQNLIKIISDFENTKLEDCEKSINEEILNNLPDAEKGAKLEKSVIFMEIYNKLDDLKEKEMERYQESIKKFNGLKKLGENNDFNSLDNELKEDVINAVFKNRDSLMSELEFIKNYLNLGYSNFDINIISKAINDLVDAKEKQ